jgi:hypothetical protein
MRSWVPGNLGRRRLPARPEGEARPRCSCLVGKSPGKSRGGLAAAGVGDLNPAPSCFHIQGRRGGCRVTCDSCAPGRDRSCPLRTSGSRCRADLARTRATTITAGSGPVRSRTPAALRSSATRNRIGQPGTARPIPLLGKWWTSCPWSTNTSPPWMQFSRNLPPRARCSTVKPPSDGEVPTSLASVHGRRGGGLPASTSSGCLHCATGRR